MMLQARRKQLAENDVSLVSGWQRFTSSSSQVLAQYFRPVMPTKRLSSALGLVLAVACAGCSGTSPHPAAQAQTQITSPLAVPTTTWEPILRSTAIKSVRPKCPQDAVHNRLTGVAVAQVFLTIDGNVDRVEILEAPSPSAGEAVSEAVVGWRFRPPAPVAGRPLRRSGKLTFYFVTKDDRCSVLYPTETFYIGRWPNTRARRESQQHISAERR
jgi:TonB family protein